MANEISVEDIEMSNLKSVLSELLEKATAKQLLVAIFVLHQEPNLKMSADSSDRELLAQFSYVCSVN
jgi:TorA maturation chaperone TorD